MGGFRSRNYPSTWEAEVGDSRVQGKSEMHCKTLAERKGKRLRTSRKHGWKDCVSQKLGRAAVNMAGPLHSEPTAAVVTCMRGKFLREWGRDTAVPAPG